MKANQNSIRKARKSPQKGERKMSIAHVTSVLEEVSRRGQARKKKGENVGGMKGRVK